VPQVYSEAELQEMELAADGVCTKADEGRLPPSCFHHSSARGGNLKRTKVCLPVVVFWGGVSCLSVLLQLLQL
jgi:hypothetical protein